MKESDSKEAQPYLFGEDFAKKAKCKLEAAAALRKSVYTSSTRGNWDFKKSSLARIGAGSMAESTPMPLENQKGTRE